MVQTTSAHPSLLWPGVKKVFGTTYGDKPMLCDRIFDEYSSDKHREDYVERGTYGLAPIKTQGAALSYDTREQGDKLQLQNVTYALGAKITMEAIQDGQYESEAQLSAKLLARAMRQTKENVFANVLNRATNSSYTGADGKELLATDHPTLSAGTQANELSVAADFSEAALEDILILIRGFKDTRGNRIEAKGEMLIVPAELTFDATRVVSSTNQSGTANNDINAMREQGLLPGGVTTWDYLTDADQWFVKTDVMGSIRQERMAPELSQDNDFDTKNACMATISRFAGGWFDWRWIAGSPGA